MSTPSPEPKRHSPLASYDGQPRIHHSAVVRASTLGPFTEVKERAALGDSELGAYSYMERHSEAIYARIGKFCAIAANARINALEHPIERVSQHKITYRANEYFWGQKLDSEFRHKRRSRQVIIGHDVWIGHGAIIKPGLTIGHGAVIGAGSIVTKDVPAYAIVAGVPAQFMRWRFPPEISERIIALSWWDWDHDRLAQSIADMRNLTIEDFLNRYEAAGYVL